MIATASAPSPSADSSASSASFASVSSSASSSFTSPSAAATASSRPTSIDVFSMASIDQLIEARTALAHTAKELETSIAEFRTQYHAEKRTLDAALSKAKSDITEFINRNSGDVRRHTEQQATLAAIQV